MNPNLSLVSKLDILLLLKYSASGRKQISCDNITFTTWTYRFSSVVLDSLSPLLITVVVHGSLPLCNKTLPYTLYGYESGPYHNTLLLTLYVGIYINRIYLNTLKHLKPYSYTFNFSHHNNYSIPHHLIPKHLIRNQLHIHFLVIDP